MHCNELLEPAQAKSRGYPDCQTARAKRRGQNHPSLIDQNYLFEGNLYRIIRIIGLNHSPLCSVVVVINLIKLV